jgi:hypothetical protein
MENRWDMIENCAYASLSNSASFTKEEHKKMIAKNQAMVFPSVLNGDDFVCIEMTNKSNGRKYILACGNEDSWLNVRYEFKIRKRWTTNRLSIGAAINTVKRGDFAGVCFVFNHDMIWLDIDDLKSIDKTNEILTFIIALVRGVPLDATNEDGKTCLVVAENETVMEKFAHHILSGNPQSLKYIEYLTSTRQQIFNMVCGDSNWDGVVMVDGSGGVTMIRRMDLKEWAQLQNTSDSRSIQHLHNNSKNDMNQVDVMSIQVSDDAKKNLSQAQKDFIVLCEKLFDCEPFCLWSEKELVSLAYTIEHMHNTESPETCREVVNDWMKRAETIESDTKTAARLALDIASRTSKIMSISLEKQLVNEFSFSYNELKKECEALIGEYSIRPTVKFGIVDKRCAPEWYDSIVPYYLNGKRIQIRDRFNAACAKMGLTIEDAQKYYDTMRQCAPGMMIELDFCLKKHAFKTHGVINVYDAMASKSVSAKSIFEAKGLARLNNFEVAILHSYIELMNIKLSNKNKQQTSRSSHAHKDKNNQSEHSPKYTFLPYGNEDKQKLIKRLQLHGEVDWNDVDAENDINPLGFICVGCDQKDQWIASRKGFMGWNVVVFDDLTSRHISLDCFTKRYDRLLAGINNEQNLHIQSQNQIVYHGESESELTNLLLSNGGVDWLNQDAYNPKSPKGVILVDKDMQNTWIARRKGFMGWNVQLIDDAHDEDGKQSVSNNVEKNFDMLRKTFLAKLEKEPDSNIMEMQEYIDLLNSLSEFDVLYCLTHQMHYDPNTKTNIPMIANLPKFGRSLYIFTDFGSMVDFEEKFNRKNMYIKLNKEDNQEAGPYDSAFQIAQLYGVRTLMVHSSSGVIPIELLHFMEAANLSNGPQVRTTAQDLEDMLRGGKKRIDFNRAHVWSLNELKLGNGKEN